MTVTVTGILRIKGGARLSGTVRVPGDKSISHRAVMLGALADGVTRARGWLAGGDTLATLGVAEALGVCIERDGGALLIHGGALRMAGGPLDCVNSGTTMRLMAGILAGQRFASVL
ncbi:MAG: 3-phosphoshikimate 1-carboxyvinyltransferase, partial [Anaerolineae bacterium]|nr:3-phosphoshikimate 1-carboxyvinyltransferase [Anaerolineae bacterium]